MKIATLAGIVLIAAGAAALALGQVKYTKETEAVKLGPVELTVKQEETVNLPVWAGLAAIAAGVVLVVVGGHSR